MSRLRCYQDKVSLQAILLPALKNINAGDANQATPAKRHEYLFICTYMRVVRYCRDMLSANDTMRQALKNLGQESNTGTNTSTCNQD
jgi:hypothetical protein